MMSIYVRMLEVGGIEVEKADGHGDGGDACCPPKSEPRLPHGEARSLSRLVRELKTSQ